MYTFSVNTWSKTDVEAITYDGEKWINKKHLEKAVGNKNLAGNKTQYYSDEFKKRRCEIQDCEDFQPCRKFIAEKLAIHLILDIKTVKAGELKTKLGFNQLDPIMPKQQSIGLKIRKTFPNEEIIEDFYVKEFDYIIESYWPKRKLVIEVDELGHKDRKPEKENTRQKEFEEYLRCVFIIINLDKKDFSAWNGLGKIQAFIDKLKDEELKAKIKELKKYKVSSKKIKKLEYEIKELKELKEEIKYLKYQLIRKSDHIE